MSENRCIYRKNQLGDVVCQLRFPEILMIAGEAPAQFQEAIREDYPIYTVNHEMPPPKITGLPGQLTLENPPAVVNHQFLSADGLWRVNLTCRYVSLSCRRYPRWEDFAQRLDTLLAHFIQIYRPAFFERIGLRYLNFFSRQALGLTGTPFRDLFAPCYLGPLVDETLCETSTSRCSIDAEYALGDQCRVKLHAGPGLIRQGNPADREVKFIFDQDLYRSGQIPVHLSAEILQTLHSKAWQLFRSAITDPLHEAMEPRFYI